jgi:hypothetical protein
LGAGGSGAGGFGPGGFGAGGFGPGMVGASGSVGAEDHDGDPGLDTGGNSDSGGPAGGGEDGGAETGQTGASQGSVRGEEKGGSGRVSGANGLRARNRKPHASQDWPELTVPHRGQVSAGLGAAPGLGAWCLPTVRTGSEAGALAM